jgi:hypothetical protein
MNNFLKPLLLSLACAAMLHAPAIAQELKIGYVNSERVLRDSQPAKAAQAKLETEFGRRDRSTRISRPCPRPNATGVSASSSSRIVTCSASAASSRKT